MRNWWFLPVALVPLLPVRSLLRRHQLNITIRIQYTDTVNTYTLKYRHKLEGSATVKILTIFIVQHGWKKYLRTYYVRRIHSAVHRPKPGSNLVIRAGFFARYFLHRRVTGCLLFAPRPDPGSSGARSPDPIAAVCSIYLFVINYISIPRRFLLTLAIIIT